MPGAGKIVRLEASRGLAALAVFFCHFFLGLFSPWLSASGASDVLPGSLVGHWYFAFVSGDAAVVFFFVLSGYVLSIKPLATRNPRHIQTSLIRRWPRLVPLVLISILISWVLYRAGLYQFKMAAALTGTHWHESWDLSVQNPSFLDAVWQGLFAVFFTGENYLNTNLWTMKREIMGSLYVFALTALVLWRQRHISICLFVLLLAVGMRQTLLPFLLGFLVALICSRRDMRGHWGVRLLLLAAGIYLLGYHSAIGDYRWVSFGGDGHPSLQHFLHKLMLPAGGALLLLFLLTGPVWNWLESRFGVWLGELSFPFYVMHTIVIWSWSSWAYLHLDMPLFLNLISSFMLVILICLPLMRLDRVWVSYLKQVTTRRDRNLVSSLQSEGNT